MVATAASKRPLASAPLQPDVVPSEAATMSGNASLVTSSSQSSSSSTIHTQSIEPIAVRGPFERHHRWVHRTISSEWVIGLSFELGATLVNVAGKQCFRLAAKRKTVGENVFFYAIGLLLIAVVYGVMNNIAVQFAPNSVVSAVDGMIIVWNILLAPMTLGEALTASRATGALLITVGTFTASTVFGNHANNASTFAGYLTLLNSTQAVVYYVVGLGLVVVVLCGLLLRYPVDTRLGGALFVVLGGWLSGNGAIFEKVMWAKDMGTMEIGAAHYITAVLYLSMCSVGLISLAVSMRHHDALFVLPIYESLVILGASTGGYAVLHEYEAEGNTSGRIIGFWISLGVLIAGLVLIVAWPDSLLGDGDREVWRWYRVCCGTVGRRLSFLDDDETHGHNEEVAKPEPSPPQVVP